MSRAATMHFVTPTYRPAGGVVKIMDYVTHAIDLGYAVSVQCDKEPAAREPLFEIDRFRFLLDHPDVEFHSRDHLSVDADDLVFISLPTNYELAARSLKPDMARERILHIIQNTRHTNPLWLSGQPLRTLTRPASRISINSIVAEGIQPYLDRHSMHRVINLGHDLEYFRQERDGGLSETFKVAYTTWKSTIGDDVASEMSGAGNFEFRAIRDNVAWKDLRELYSWADIFLCTPSPQEGLYLPGLEAMSAGCIVVSPDVEGNMAYCRPGANCFLVEYESTSSYTEAIHQIAQMSQEQHESYRRSGAEVCEEFKIESERRDFGHFVSAVLRRAEEVEAAQ